MGQGTLRAILYRRWRYGRFYFIYNGCKPQFLQTIVHVLDYEIRFSFFFENARRWPDINGRDNVFV